MKQLISFLFIFLFLQNSWAQKIERHQFNYTSTELEKVLLDIEKKFSVKFSYVDEIVKNKKISLFKKKYSLAELSSEIENQTQLKAIKIDNRFYSIIKKYR